MKNITETITNTEKGDLFMNNTNKNEYIHTEEDFFGKKISEFGLKAGRVDYAAFANAFDAIRIQNIEKLFGNVIDGEYVEAEQINGIVDYSEEISSLEEELEEIREQENLDEEFVSERGDQILEKIEEYKEMENYPPEIMEYFIVSPDAVSWICDFTDDPLFYLPVLDCYVWGTTFTGCSWSMMLTDLKLKLKVA